MAIFFIFSLFLEKEIVLSFLILVWFLPPLQLLRVPGEGFVDSRS